MTQENKELLLRDLCSRLPYGVCVEIDSKSVDGKRHTAKLCEVNASEILKNIETLNVQPILRPMSSMTEEEYKIYHELVGGMFGTGILINLPILEDFLNKNHFDYRGLIEKNLALGAPKGMYNLKIYNYGNN